MNVKKALLLLMVFVLLTGVFASCKTSTASLSPTPTESASEKVGPEILPEPGTVFKGHVYYKTSDEKYPWSSLDSVTATKMTERIEQLEETYQITIEYVDVAEFGDVLNMATTAAANSYVVDFMNGCGPHSFANFYNTGGLVAISDYLNQYDFRNPDYYDQSIQDGQLTVDGKLYAVCPHRVGVSSVDFNVVLFFNKAILKDLVGVEPQVLYDSVKNGSWTWERFEEYAVKGVKKDQDDGFLIAGTRLGRGTLGIQLVLSNNGNVIDTRDGKDRFTLNEPNAVEAYHFMKTLYEKGAIETTAGDAENDISDFKKGKVLFVVHDANRIYQYNLNSSDEKKRMKDPFGIVLMPKGPKATDYMSDLNFYDTFIMLKGNPNVAAAAFILGKVMEPIYKKGEDGVLFDAEITSYVSDQNDIDMFKLALDKTFASKYWRYAALATNKLYQDIYDLDVEFVTGEIAIQAHMDAIAPGMNDMIDSLYTQD